MHGALVCLHWGVAAAGADRETVCLDDAIRSMVRCRPGREVVAALDSILHRGLRSMQELQDLFATLPARYLVLLALADARAESGPETLVRLMLRQLGVEFDLQVSVAGVGRVDFLVGARLIIECDSRAHHADWDQRRRDIRRDQEAARRGFVTVRLLAEDILFHPERVLPVLADVVRAHV